MLSQYRWFLAHASKDKAWVRTLWRLLDDAGLATFFDEESLLPGDEWDLEIPRALASSDGTVVCISPHFDGAWFLRAEVQRAIRQRRQGGGEHRLVPVYLPGADPGAVYGLEMVHGLDASALGVAGVAEKLIALSRRTGGGGPVAVSIDQGALFAALCALLDGQWAHLLMDPALRPASSMIPGPAASPATRAAELVRWAENQGLLEPLYGRVASLAPGLLS